MSLQGAVVDEGTELTGREGILPEVVREGHSQREGPEVRVHNLLSLKENMSTPSVIMKSKLLFHVFFALKHHHLLHAAWAGAAMSPTED